MPNFKIPYFQPAITTNDMFLWFRDFFGRWSGDTLLKTRVIDLPGWDMVTDQQIQVPYGDDIQLNRIVAVKVTIINDDQDEIFDSNMNGSDPSFTGLQQISWDEDVVTILNRANGFFDDANFDDDTISRGYLTIWYTT